MFNKRPPVWKSPESEENARGWNSPHDPHKITVSQENRSLFMGQHNPFNPMGPCFPPNEEDVRGLSAMHTPFYTPSRSFSGSCTMTFSRACRTDDYAEKENALLGGFSNDLYAAAELFDKGDLDSGKEHMTKALERMNCYMLGSTGLCLDPSLAGPQKVSRGNACREFGKAIDKFREKYSSRGISISVSFSRGGLFEDLGDLLDKGNACADSL